MKRFLITVPVEFSLSAENEQDARVELLKVRSEIKEAYYTARGTVSIIIPVEKAKVEELPF